MIGSYRLARRVAARRSDTEFEELAMGFRDRDYYRDDSRGDSGLPILTPAIKFLIIANVVVFLLQIFVVREVRMTPLEAVRRIDPELDQLLTKSEAGDEKATEKLKKRYGDLLDRGQADLDLPNFGLTVDRVPVVQEWFELKTSKVVRQGQLWRVVTHAFCHSRAAIWHILLNMLALYWFGGVLESMYGSREFLLFYFAAILAAAAAYIGLDLYTGADAPAIGASGGVMAVMMLYTWHFPRTIIYIFWVIPLEMRFLMAIYVLWDLHPVLLTLSGDRHSTGIAHAAHLGGLAFGFLYGKFGWRLSSAFDRIGDLGFWRSMARRSPLRSRPRLRIAPEPASDDDEARRIDEILQKILESGRSSLTAEERELLQRASERLRRGRE